MKKFNHYAYLFIIRDKSTGKVLASYINNAILKYGNQITDNIPKIFWIQND